MQARCWFDEQLESPSRLSSSVNHECMYQSAQQLERHFTPNQQSPLQSQVQASVMAEDETYLNVAETPAVPLFHHSVLTQLGFNTRREVINTEMQKEQSSSSFLSIMRHPGDCGGFPESRILIFSVFSIIFSLKYIMTGGILSFYFCCLQYIIQDIREKKINISVSQLIHFLDESQKRRLIPRSRLCAKSHPLAQLVTTSKPGSVRHDRLRNHKPSFLHSCLVCVQM